jgi:hypothetical protein
MPNGNSSCMGATGGLIRAGCRAIARNALPAGLEGMASNRMLLSRLSRTCSMMPFTTEPSCRQFEHVSTVQLHQTAATNRLTCTDQSDSAAQL